MRRLVYAVPVVAVLLALPIIASAFGQPSWVSLGTQIAIYGVATMGVELVLGNGGLISLGQAGYFGIGGYVAGIIASHLDAGVPLLGWSGTSMALVIWPLAAVISGLLALVIGLVCLRVSGSQFIMLTLAFGQLIHLLLVSLAPYGGDDGLLLQSRARWPSVGVPDDTAFYYICWSVLGLLFLVLRHVLASPFGVVVNGLRQNGRRMSSLGVRPFPLRLASFTLSAACMGLAGAMWADFATFISPDMASWQLSGEFLSMSILGGVGHLGGAVLGAASYEVLQTLCSGLTERWSLVFGTLLVVIVLFTKGGLYAALRRLSPRVAP